MQRFKKSEVDLAPSLKLPFTPNISELLAEFRREVEPHCPSNISKNPKRVGWKQYKVFLDQKYLKEGSEVVFDFHRLPVLQSLLNESVGKSRLIGAMYAIVPPNGFIGIHKDGIGATSEKLRSKIEDSIRLHIPLITNELVIMYIGDRFQRMKTGELWMLNNYAYHGVMNVHESAARNHLILDVIPSPEFVAELQSMPEPAGYQDNAYLKQLLRHTDKQKARQFKRELPVAQRARLIFA